MLTTNYHREKTEKNKLKKLEKLEELAGFLSTKSTTQNNLTESSKKNLKTNQTSSSLNFENEAKTMIDENCPVNSIEGLRDSLYNPNSLIFLNFDYENLYKLLSEFYVEIIMNFVSLLYNKKVEKKIDLILLKWNEFNYVIERETRLLQGEIDTQTNLELGLFLLTKIIFENMQIINNYPDLKEEIYIVLTNSYKLLYENYLQLIACNSMYENKDAIIFTHNTDQFDILGFENKCVDLYYEYYDTKILNKRKTKEIILKNSAETKRSLVHIIQIIITILHNQENASVDLLSLLQSIFSFIHKKNNSIGYHEMRLLFQQKYWERSLKYFLIINLDNVILSNNLRKQELYLRPYTDYFFETLGSYFDIFLISSYEKDVINSFITSIKLEKKIKTIFLSKNTISRKIEDFIIENEKKIIVIDTDNTDKQIFKYEIDNIVYISEFDVNKSGEEDDILFILSNHLKYIVEGGMDVREALDKVRENK